MVEIINNPVVNPVGLERVVGGDKRRRKRAPRRTYLCGQDINGTAGAGSWYRHLWMWIRYEEEGRLRWGKIPNTVVKQILRKYDFVGAVNQRGTFVVERIVLREGEQPEETE